MLENLLNKLVFSTFIPVCNGDIYNETHGAKSFNIC